MLNTTVASLLEIVSIGYLTNILLAISLMILYIKILLSLVGSTITSLFINMFCLNEKIIVVA